MGIQEIKSYTSVLYTVPVHTSTIYFDHCEGGYQQAHQRTYLVPKTPRDTRPPQCRWQMIKAERELALKLRLPLILCHDFVCDVVVPTCGISAFSTVAMGQPDWQSVEMITIHCAIAFCSIWRDQHVLPMSSKVTASPCCRGSWSWTLPAKGACCPSIPCRAQTWTYKQCWNRSCANKLVD